MAIAKTPKVEYAFALMSGCLFWYNFTIQSTAITYMKLESINEKCQKSNNFFLVKYVFTKLKVSLTGANVVASAQDTFHDQRHAHGIEQAVVLRNTVLL